MRFQTAGSSRIRDRNGHDAHETILVESKLVEHHVRWRLLCFLHTVMITRTLTFDVWLDRHAHGATALLPTRPRIAATGSEGGAALARLEELLEILSHHNGGTTLLSAEADASGELYHLSLTLPVSDGVTRHDIELDSIAVYVRSNSRGTRMALPRLDLDVEISPNVDLEEACLEQITRALNPRERLEALSPHREACREEASRDVELRALTVEREAAREPNVREEHLPSGVASRVVPLHQRWDRKDSPRAFERDREVETIIHHLSASRREGLLLVGAMGVGKTSLVAEVVHRILREEVPAELHDTPVWRLDEMPSAFDDGTWRERTEHLLEAIGSRGGMLVVDHLVEWVDEARQFGEASHLEHVLIPHLRTGDLECVTEARPGELGYLERYVPTLFGELRRLSVDAISPSRTETVLERVSFRLGRQQGARLDTEARRAVIEVTERFQAHAELPGPAVDLAERTARTYRDDAIDVGDDRPVLRPRHVFEAFSSQTGLPVSVLDLEMSFSPDDVRAHVEREIVGQPEGIEAIVDVVNVVRAGLNPPGRPIGSYLFVGPTGVGKTQTALALADYLFGSEERLLRFDMTEYQHARSAGRLVGRRQGERGELARHLRDQPFQVLLLDEIEKAHPSIFDLLLQVLGEGRLTDGVGRTVSTRHCIVIMTSNVGTDEVSSLEFQGNPEAHRQHYLDEVESFFRPEFIGRLDDIVPFRPLDASVARSIVEQALDEALAREGITRRRLDVDVDEAMFDYLVQVGVDARYGARPLRRAVEEHVVAPLGAWLSSHPNRTDTTLRVQLSDEDEPEIVVAS